MRDLRLLPIEVRRTVDDMLNGMLAEKELIELERHLDGDATLQSQFRSYCQLHINLDTETRAQRVIDEVTLSIASDLLIHIPGAAEVRELRTSSSAARRSSLATLIAMAVCLFLMISILALAIRSSVPFVAMVPGTAANSEPGDRDTITVRLTTAESRTLPIGDVGSVSIQGPAHFELIGTTRGRLHQGRIKVRIDDERGHGFVVETPRGHVTDLGTEFGVDVDGDSTTGVVVFEGEVDLTLPAQSSRGGLTVERLIQGDGLSLQYPGHSDRIMSIVTGNFATFQRQGDSRLATGVIADVSDNIRSKGFKKFYEIVPGGLQEDALAYADRPHHNWNGVDEAGMPKYLLGADYIKPFNSDKLRDDVEIEVAIAKPARLFVFMDNRVARPPWLTESFRNTGDAVGLDAGPFDRNGEELPPAVVVSPDKPLIVNGEEHPFTVAVGPGKSIDARFSIWVREVDRPGIIRLGPNLGASDFTAMYSIAAVSLETSRDQPE